MTMNWSQQKYECKPVAEREADRYLHTRPKLLPFKPRDQKRDRRLAEITEQVSRPSADDARKKKRFDGWDVMLAALGGGIVFFFLSVASAGVLTSAVIVAALMFAVWLAYFFVWGRTYARQAGTLEVSVTAPPDEFLLELNNRERTELLKLLEHSLEASVEGREGAGDSTAIRREVQARIRMFGA